MMMIALMKSKSFFAKQKLNALAHTIHAHIYTQTYT